jgi:DNA-binding MarR family transcriptional regulator
VKRKGSDPPLQVPEDWAARRRRAQGLDHVDGVVEQWARERPDLDLAPVEVVARLGRAARLLDDGMERLFAEHGLTRASWDVLASLRRAGEPYRLSPTQLYRELMRTSGAMTNRLQGLERDELIRRVPDPGDGRGMLVELTAKGRRLVDRVASEHLANERRMLEGLSPAKQKQLAGLLRDLLLSLESSRQTT